MSDQISRRTFLGGALALGAAGIVQSAVSSNASASLLLPHSPTTLLPDTGKILVIVTLYGGLDGLNTVVPYQDSSYYSIRGNVGIPAANVLPIVGGMGLHPALTGTKTLFDAGNVAIIRGVGYPKPSYSHFSSMDIWQSGSPSGDVTTGWIGRWLDRTGKSPLRAISVGPNLPLAFVGRHQRASAITASSTPISQLPPNDPTLVALYEGLERKRRGQTPLEVDVVESATSMLSVSRIVAQALTQIPSPVKSFGSSSGTLGTQLGVVAQLISAGLPTKVYGVELGGFDSHSGEITSYSPLLGQLDASISGFFKAIQGSPLASDVVMFVYTEFGRRVQPNASLGTDHGSGNVAFVIGSGVQGGFYGDQPSLTQLDSNGSLLVTTDYRSIYSTLLDQVLDITPSSILATSPTPIGFLS
jgi:uncharacterized protein (DUF1501 family)